MTNSLALDYSEQCPTAIVSLNNGAFESQGHLQGVYHINGTHTWTSVSHAIWYHSEYDIWLIGSKEDIGTTICGIYAYDNNGGLDDANNEWTYYNGSNWTPAAANDIIINCTSNYFGTTADPGSTTSPSGIMQKATKIQQKVKLFG